MKRKRGLEKDLRLFQIRWRSRYRSKIKKLKSSQNTRKHFSRNKSHSNNSQLICALHEVGHMVLLHYLVPTEKIEIKIWENDDLEWEGEAIPDSIPTNPDYLSKSLVAGFLAEVMAHRVLSKLSYEDCYNIFRTQPETISDYKGFQDSFKKLFGVEAYLTISELEYYISIHEEVYGYFLIFGIDRMYKTAQILEKKNYCTYRDSVNISIEQHL